MAEPQMIYGTFKEETKNRFLCQVTIDGEDVECYIPSSCRLENFIDMKGRTVLLRHNQAKNARTQYAIYAVKIKNEYLLLNLSQANRIIEAALPNRRFSFLGPRKQIIREKIIGDYKSDLYIADSKTLLEVKSILSFQRTALFPTVYSERGIKQLAQLSSLLDEGFKACYLFVSFNHRVKDIRINDGIEEYARLFDACLEKGMTIYGVTVKMKDGRPIIHSTIPALIRHQHIRCD